MAWRSVEEWDEYGQGYDAAGRLIVCICGASVAPGGVGHHCSYDEPEPEGVEAIDQGTSRSST